MNRRLGFVVLVLVMSCAPKPTRPTTTSASAQVSASPPTVAPEQPVIPGTPAGKTLRAWLDAFNSADDARIEAFVSQYKHPQPAGAMRRLRNNTGGFDLLGIKKSERLALEFLVKAKGSPTTAVGRLKVKDTDPAEIDSFRLLAIPPGVTADQMDLQVDVATRARVIDAIAAKLTEYYVYPDTAKKMIAALRDHQKAGAYDTISDARDLTHLLTDHLQEVSHDRHLLVEFVPTVVPEGDPEPSAEDKARFRERLEHINCGFEKAERLDGNIGYIKFNTFGDADVCGPKATAALGSLGDVDALIFDLRDNGGGDPEMVAFVSSYLFAKRTHLNDLYRRKDDETTQYWTKPEVPGPKLVNQPVYVLTSSHTFSAAEGFSYHLKNLKRATIVGETTGGGAHPTTGLRLDDHFMIDVPIARAINPITKTNWEGTGVEPDVKVPADQALETAKKLATDAIAKQKQGARAK